jgi:hypothetical protein
MIIVTRECDKCPFLNKCGEERRCNVTFPKNRPILPEDRRPTWCPLRKENYIVKEPPQG